MTKEVPLTEEQIIRIQEVLSQVYRTRLFPELLPAQFKYLTELQEIWQILENYREKKQTKRLSEEL